MDLMIWYEEICRMNKYLKLYLLIPLLLFLVTLILIIRGNKKRKYSVCCEGTIVGFYISKPRSSVGADIYSGRAYAPIVAYNVNGKTYKFVAKFCSSSMKTGDKVKVLYNNDDHTVASIKKGIYVLPAITGVLTLCSVVPIVIYIML